MERINWIFRCRTLCWIFWKYSLKKIKYSRNLPDPENYWLFLFGFCQFPTVADNSGKPKSVDSKQKNKLKLGEKNFLDYLKRFLKPIKKNPYTVNYWWTCVSNYVCSAILVITKIYIFLILLQVVVGNVKSTSLDCMNSNI